MKKITNYLKTIVLLGLLAGYTGLNAQCTVGFNYWPGSNGVINFYSNTNTNTVTTTYYWNFGNNTTYSATGFPRSTAVGTYTANGTYVVTLFIISSSPSCSTAAQQTITVVNGSTCNVNANFSTSQGSNGVVNFNNLTTGTLTGVTYTWKFGDSSPTSNATSPVHTYSANGNYQVMLIANNNTTPVCIDSTVMMVFVNSYCNINAGFNYNLNSNGNVQFFNTTTPSVGVSYVWAFGNNTFSTNTNPNITYTANGTYVVSLTAFTSSLCSSNTTQTITITNSNTCAVNANFTASHGSNGLVNFNNTSTGTNGSTTYTWTFGDNSSPVTNTSTAHTYTANGSYVVTLVATNGPSCSSTKTLMVNVNSICNLVASFGYTVGNNGVVNFASTSTGVLQGYIFQWSFGDNTNGFGSSVNHTYPNGTYNVVLTVKNSSVNATCTSTVMQQVTVNTNTCTANAGFSVVPTGTPQYWNAIPANPGNVVNAIWHWGDGSTSNTLYTAHQYSAAGTYDLCLSVTVACGASDFYCSTYSIFRTSGNNEVIHINVVDEAAVGLTEMQNDNAFYSVYPNPANGELSVRITGLKSGAATVAVYNVAGSLVLVKDHRVADGMLNEELDLRSVKDGIYLIQVKAGDQTYSKKVVISK